MSGDLGRSVSREVIERAPRDLVQLEALLAERDRYQEALAFIRDMDPVDAVLDPDRAIRVARQALDD